MTQLGTLCSRLFFTVGLALTACSAPKAEPTSAAPGAPEPAERPEAAPAKAEAPKPPEQPADPPGAIASMPDTPETPPEGTQDTEAAPQADADRRPHPGLLDPSLARETAPERYTVLFATTEGDVLIDVRRSWAPIGADRFYNLVKVGAFNSTAFFRVVDGFMAQIGINGDPAVNDAWRHQKIDDDPVTQSNTRGMITFATSGRNSRVNQVFINFGDNSRLDAMGFAPFGKVRDMHVMDKIYSGYGEGAPAGRGPMQARVQKEGNAYLMAEFPELDYVKLARVTQEFQAPPKPRVSH